jgi:hypothetical protein
MAPQYDFKLALTRTIEPTGGPDVELATLEDAVGFVALLRPFRQARPHWDFAAELLLKAAETREEEDIEAATAQMERALRVEGVALRCHVVMRNLRDDFRVLFVELKVTLIANTLTDRQPAPRQGGL